MNVSRRWLEAFLHRPLDTADLVPRLAMLGLPADGVERLHAELAPVVVGQVVELAAHPNADRLRICQVEIGNGARHQVVTGAPNVALEGKYPFAGVGVTLPGGLKLEKRKLRGEISEGMLCSARELGLGQEHEGLMALDPTLVPGTPVVEALGLADERLLLDISPVRGDLLGHKGIARELAASLKTAFRLPEIPGKPRIDVSIRRVTEWEATLGSGLRIGIESGSSCRRFAVAAVDGVRVGPSPEWLRRRLESVGQRSINNVVDVTNYVMFELGQPLHGYDAERIRDQWLGGRLAADGERLTTLDGVSRVLGSTMTVVADGAGPVGVAGVMGGSDSEVGESTTRVLLESAWWEPAQTRITRKQLGIATEASQRFERGTDLWAIPDALRRAVEIVVAVAGGSFVEGLDLWPEPSYPPRVFVRQKRVAQVVGLDLTLPMIENALTAIGATVSPRPDDGRVAVDVPGWRRDLDSEIDLVEEVVRLYGYDLLPDELRPFRAGAQVDDPAERVSRALRTLLVEEGMLETVLLPFHAEESEPAVSVLNPLSADHKYLRRRLVTGLVRQVEANWAAQVRDVRLFEIGSAFSRGNAEQRPAESLRVAGVITGSRQPAHWTSHGVAEDVDWWEAKRLFEAVVSLANPRALVQVDGPGLVARVSSGDTSSEGHLVGWLGMEPADAPPWAAPVFGFEVVIDSTKAVPVTIKSPPTVPAIARDLSFFVPPAITWAAIERVVRTESGPWLESLQVVDEYRRDGQSDQRSLTFRMVFRAADRTLRDSDIDRVMERLIRMLKERCGLELRTI